MRRCAAGSGERGYGRASCEAIPRRVMLRGEERKRTSSSQKAPPDGSRWVALDERRSKLLFGAMSGFPPPERLTRAGMLFRTPPPEGSRLDGRWAGSEGESPAHRPRPAETAEQACGSSLASEQSETHWARVNYVDSLITAEDYKARGSGVLALCG
jgi:hypothetical protein